MKPIPDKEWLTALAAQWAKLDRWPRIKASLPWLIVICLCVAVLCVVAFWVVNQ